VDARNGIVEQTRRHSIIASLLNIPHVVVAINKMDLVDYSQDVFNNIVIDFAEIAKTLDLKDVIYIPISALKGDNIVDKSVSLSWYEGDTLLEQLENIALEKDVNLSQARLPVQYVIRPQTEELHDYRGYAGKIISGIYKRGDAITILPSGLSSKIKTIEAGGKEVEEAFAKGQKGSSAMPHKRNPIGSENMTGLARVIRGYMLTAYENVPLWHERDISHSSAERIIIPDATIALNYMLNRFGNIVKNLTVFPENMKRNMERTHGLIYSQRVLLALIDKGLSREEAYDTVQPKTMESWETQVPFRTLIEAEEKINSKLSPEEIADCFDYNYHLKNVDYIFEKLGL
jgi:hypothetical protein